MNNKTSEESAEFYHVMLEEYFSRRAKNNNFSIRAFAKKLDIDQSLLTKFLKGKTEVSTKTKKKCLLSLGYSQGEIEGLLKNAKSDGRYAQVKEEHLTVLTNWYSFAIIELLKIQKGLSIEDIARRFSISKEEVAEAMTLLMQYGYLSISPNGSFSVVRKNNSWLSLTSTSDHRKKYQRSLMARSMKALDEVDVANRHHISMTVAIDKSRLHEIKKRISVFQRELADELGTSGDPDEVYQIIVNFFPLTQWE